MGAKSWLGYLMRGRQAGASRPPWPAVAAAEGAAGFSRGSHPPPCSDPVADVPGVAPDTPWGRPPLSAALAKVRHAVDPAQFQMFHLQVLRHWPARKVARKLGVSLHRVYLAKYRIGRQIKTEVKRLRAEPS